MCKTYKSSYPENRINLRYNILKKASRFGVAKLAAGSMILQSNATGAAGELHTPQTSNILPASNFGYDLPGQNGRSYVIRGGTVLSMDAKVGDFDKADVLVEGNKIVAISPNIDAGDSTVIDATGKIVMPGFIDTHHHQFEPHSEALYLMDCSLMMASHMASSTTWITYLENWLLFINPKTFIYPNYLAHSVSLMQE
jgi:hypothetical protein